MNDFNTYFWIFLLGSVVGWIVEVVFAYVKTGKFQNRSSVIYGPFGFAYGITAIFLTYIYTIYDYDSIVSVFLTSFIIGSVLEYIMSIGMEYIYGYVAWDYSKKKFNLFGRICLQYSFYWGFLGVCWYYLIMDQVLSISNYIDNKASDIINLIIIFLILNIVISFLAVRRSFNRAKGINDFNFMSNLLDKYYSDEYLKKVLPQMFEYRRIS